MKINLIKQILFLMLFASFYGELNAQVWSKSFTAGGYDSNKKLLGGSEVLQLIGHKDMLCDPDISIRIHVQRKPKCIPVYSDSRLVDIVCSTLLW
jgi:hypothetical protein